MCMFLQVQPLSSGEKLVAILFSITYGLLSSHEGQHAGAPAWVSTVCGCALRLLIMVMTLLVTESNDAALIFD